MLIAEIGNCHFGDFNRAKELIRMANECGADLIKGQAFRCDDITTGSMPASFYKLCAFTINQYIELIDYARSIGNDLFFSIFSKGFEQLAIYQSWHKLSGAQTKSGMGKHVIDAHNLIVSVPSNSSVPRFKRASVLYVSEYLTNSPELEYITILSEHLGRQAGYSDHTIGVGHAVRARRFFGADVIEKHFCLAKSETYKGVVFRDTVHGATPIEFAQLAKELSR